MQLEKKQEPMNVASVNQVTIFLGLLCIGTLLGTIHIGRISSDGSYGLVG
jgi:hypothetical protein